jgi:hypothetical protein
MFVRRIAVAGNRRKTHVKETKELNPGHAAPKTNPKQLLELSRLEIKRRELWQDLAYVQGEQQ